MQSQLTPYTNQPWGLFKRRNPAPIPLKSLDISIKILHNVARVFYTQVYHNDTNTLLETEFFFPISPDACFDSFEAKFKDTIIKGVIKEKEKAKEEYKEALEKGDTVAYSEIQEDTGDIMKVLIGNIPPNVDVSITYSYIQKLETSLNKFWCFRLFSTLTPRYNGNISDYLKHDISVLTKYPTISSKNSQAYPWTIKAEIQSPSPISLLKSPSHKIVTSFGNENHTCTITLDPKFTYSPNKDFVLLYNNGKENALDYVLTPFEDGYCAMLTYLADFDKVTPAEAYNNLAKAKVSEDTPAMNSVRGEYVFLIDRSGSMKGDRISMAKESLLLFLKSLPQDSYFNVVSFGSQFSMIIRSSAKYSQQSLTHAISQVEGFQADMGGTEIYNALKAVFNTPLVPGYPRSVFLLTDGAVSNTKQVLQLINTNRDNARIFTIGVGNGCSPELVTKCASYGQGKHEFVANNSEIYEKVINLLDASLSSCYSDIALQGENFDAVVKSLSPNPTSMPYLLNGQQATFFLFLRDAAFQNEQGKMTIKLEMYDSQIQKKRAVEITIDSKEALDNDLVAKLAIHDMIKRLEAEKNNTPQKDKNIIWADKAEINKALLEFSLKYGVLCNETAFLCEISQKGTNTPILQKTHKIVPTILSQDYSEKKKAGFKCMAKAPMFKPGYRGMAVPMSSLRSVQDQAIIAFDVKSCKKSISSARPTSASTAKLSTALARRREDKEAQSLDELEDESYNASVKFGGSKQSTTTNLAKGYLNVIMKQSFEGSWDSKDKELSTLILKGKNLPQIPEQLKVTGELTEKIWMTILVLAWLEAFYNNDRKAWKLVHQKGCEWLKSNEVNYEEVKGLANFTM